MPWIELTELDQLNVIKKQSFKDIVLIFKDSTSCSISQIAKHSLQKEWDQLLPIAPYYLNIQKYREISDVIAEDYKVVHESPQILMIKNGECFHDASHFDINMTEVLEVLDYHGFQ